MNHHVCGKVVRALTVASAVAKFVQILERVNFGRVKIALNLPRFSPAIILHYTVICAPLSNEGNGMTYHFLEWGRTTFHCILQVYTNPASGNTTLVRAGAITTDGTSTHCYRKEPTDNWPRQQTAGLRNRQLAYLYSQLVFRDCLIYLLVSCNLR